jgi:enoyl-CoA hydratase/carnithine racemase
MDDVPMNIVASETLGRVRLVTLNRPSRRNALGTSSMRALEAALQAAEADPTIGAVLLRAAPPAFCAGSDLKELAGLDAAGMAAHEAITAAVTRRIPLMAKPVIAAVEGYALGGGFILAASCDVVVTARDARWHLPEVTNGWLPPWGLGALIARVGAVRARLLTWGAEPILGEEAQRLGVADLVAEPGGAEARALQLAQALAGLPPEAVASTKRFYEAFAAMDAERLDAVAGRAFAADCASPAARATFARFGARP